MPDNTNQFYVDHAGMGVPDLDATIEWYGRVFELKVTRQFSTPAFKAVFMEREGARLEIFQALPPPPVKSVKPLTLADLDPTMVRLGFTHVAFGVPDVDTAWKLVVSRGATAIMAPNTQGGSRCGHVGDLNQNIVELIQPVPVA